MKTKITIAILVLAIAMTGCRKETITGNPAAAANSSTSSITGSLAGKPAPASMWKVTNFIRNGDDITGMFDSFIIMLSVKNNAGITNGYITIPGTWELAGNIYRFSFDINAADIPSSSTFINLAIFNELNGDWNIIKTFPTGVLLESTMGKEYKLLQLENL